MLASHSTAIRQHCCWMPFMLSFEASQDCNPTCCLLAQQEGNQPVGSAVSPVLSLRCWSAAAESPPLRHTGAISTSSALGLGLILPWAVHAHLPPAGALLFLLLLLLFSTRHLLSSGIGVNPAVQAHLPFIWGPAAPPVPLSCAQGASCQG